MLKSLPAGPPTTASRTQAVIPFEPLLSPPTIQHDFVAVVADVTGWVRARLLAFRSSFGLGVLVVGAHVLLQWLNLTAIAAYLFRTLVHAFKSRLRIRRIGLRERVLILGGPVANPLLRTIAVCRADFAPG